DAVHSVRAVELKPVQFLTARCPHPREPVPAAGNDAAVRGERGAEDLPIVLEARFLAGGLLAARQTPDLEAATHVGGQRQAPLGRKGDAPHLRTRRAADVLDFSAGRVP